MKDENWAEELSRLVKAHDLLWRRMEEERELRALRRLRAEIEAAQRREGL